MNKGFELQNNVSVIGKEHTTIDEEKLKVIVREIEVKSNKIIEIYSGFNKKYEDNISLIDLYKHTDENLKLKNRKYRYYSIILKNHIFSEENKETILNCIANILETKIIKNFFRYKKFLNNHSFYNIKKEAKVTDINLCISKISGLLNNSFALLPPIYNNEYTSEFIEYGIFTNNLNNDQIREIVQEVNLNHNGDLIKRYEKNLNSNIINLFSRLNSREKKKKDLKTYNDLEEEIYSQYKENIDCLKIYVKSFNFLKSTILDEEIDKIKDYILNEDEFTAYLIEIKDNLSKYNNYLKLKENIDTLEPLTIKLLDFIYDNSNSIAEGETLCDFIQKSYYPYKLIDDLEHKNKIINDYKNIDELFNTLLKPILYLFNNDSRYIDIKSLLNDLYADKNEAIIEVDKPSKSSYMTYEVLNLLNSWGYKVLNNYEYKGYKLNHVITSNEEENFIALQFDNDDFGEEEIKKLLFLKYNNIDILFLWSRNWWSRRSNEIIKMRALLNTLI